MNKFYLTDLFLLTWFDNQFRDNESEFLHVRPSLFISHQKQPNLKKNHHEIPVLFYWFLNLVNNLCLQFEFFIPAH